MKDNDFASTLLIALTASIVTWVTAVIFTNNSWVTDCKVLGAHNHAGVAYICEVKK